MNYEHNSHRSFIIPIRRLRRKEVWCNYGDVNWRKFLIIFPRCYVSCMIYVKRYILTTTAWKHKNIFIERDLIMARWNFHFLYFHKLANIRIGLWFHCGTPTFIKSYNLNRIQNLLHSQRLLLLLEKLGQTDGQKKNERLSFLRYY